MALFRQVPVFLTCRKINKNMPFVASNGLFCVKCIPFIIIHENKRAISTFNHPFFSPNPNFLLTFSENVSRKA